MDNGVNTYPLGATAVSGESPHLLGSRKTFKNIDPTDHKTVLDSQDKVMQWVKNSEASATIAKNVALTWAAGVQGTGVKVAGLADLIVGFADDNLVNAVANGSYFWMCVKGPNQMISDGSGALALNDPLVSAAAGEVKRQVAAPADSTAAIIQVTSVGGFAPAVVAATAHLAFRGFVKPYGNS